MTLKIGINGFNRIGRLVARIAMDHPEVELVGFNDLVPADNLAYLFKYDSTHGSYKGTVTAKDEGIEINGHFVLCMAIKNPAELPWNNLGADYVVESTGFFTTYEGAENHLKTGAKRVMLSAPTKDPDKVRTFVLGVNHQEFDPAKDAIASNANCTTNCLAPVAKVLNDTFGIAEGLMTTVHFMTATHLK
jgi:glyceraldehyde 3-phosphate dehydrogenase